MRFADGIVLYGISV